MTNCPHCGASDNDGVFACGSCYFRDELSRTDRCKASEVEQLRAEIASLKRRIEEAEPLVWEERNRKCKRRLVEAWTCFGCVRVYFAGDKSTLAMKRPGEGIVTSGPFTFDQAKQRAEELHQQEWARIVETWGRKE